MKFLTVYRYLDKGALRWYPHQGILYKSFVDKLEEGDTVEIRLKKQQRTKTNPQLGYWYGVLIPFAVNVLREAGYNTLFDISVGDLKTGVATNKDTVDLLFKTLFMHHVSEKNLPLKRNMTTQEMSDLIDFALKWMAENLGAFCPTPKDNLC